MELVKTSIEIYTGLVTLGFPSNIWTYTDHKLWIEDENRPKKGKNLYFTANFYDRGQHFI